MDRSREKCSLTIAGGAFQLQFAMCNAHALAHITYHNQGS